MFFFSVRQISICYNTQYTQSWHRSVTLSPTLHPIPLTTRAAREAGLIPEGEKESSSEPALNGRRQSYTPCLQCGHDQVHAGLHLRLREGEGRCQCYIYTKAQGKLYLWIPVAWDKTSKPQSVLGARLVFWGIHDDSCTSFSFLLLLPLPTVSCSLPSTLDFGYANMIYTSISLVPVAM